MEGLNEQQMEATLHKDGPLLIVAGAGAGKTKTITSRITHLVKNGVAPENILAVTFTNKAAKEMKDRISGLLHSDKSLNMPATFDEVPFVSTFHSLGVHIIKENARIFGLTRFFSIFDRDDSRKAIKQSLVSNGLDPKRFEPGKILGVISREKGNFVTLEEYLEKAQPSYFTDIVSSVWKKYEEILFKEKALDFDDLILKTAHVLKNNKEVRSYYENKWRYLHIDEYQDTNKSQYIIAECLSEKNRNICAVGDADQMIYGWRGANIRNILDFEKDFPDARTVVLEQNYRSTQNILRSANMIIRKNKKRKEKNLFSEKEEGEKISLFEGYDEVEEAHFVAEKARELAQAGVNRSDIAVLFRANFQSRALEEAFLSHSIPYQVLGTRFFERKEIKDALSYIKAGLNPDSMNDLKRVINVPPRGLGKVALVKILAGRESELPAAQRAKIAEFRNLLAKIRAASETVKPSEIIKMVIKLSGLENTLKNGTEEDAERMENLKELVTVALKYDYLGAREGVEKLLEEAALASDQDELEVKKEGVKLMTVHASKGLEFEYVFVCGLEEDLFPHRNMSEDNIAEEKSEEERRLFYVALTRAKKKVYLTFAGIRTIFGTKHMNIPSEFLSDIDDSLIEKEEGDHIKEIRF